MKNKLQSYSEAELQAELARRNKAAIPRPLPKEEIDWEVVKGLAMGVIADIADDAEDEDTKHYIYEEVMKAVFGADVFTWINKRGRL